MAEYYRDPSGCYIRSDKFEQFRHLALPNETGIRYTHKNEKKAYQIRMLGWPGAISSWQWKNLNKIPDTIKHYKDLGNGYIKIPLGLSSFYHQSYTRNYDAIQTNHPAIKRNSYPYQATAIDNLLTRTVWLLHASTWSGKTQIIADITSRLKRNTLIVVQNLTQMAQMVKDIEVLLWVTPTQVSGKELTKFAQYWEVDWRKEIEEECKHHWIRISRAATKKYWPADTVESLKQKLNDAWFPFQEPVSKIYPYITVCSIDSRDKVNPKDFGLILLDECDTYMGSDERREWVGSLSPEYMYWLTGTIEVNHMNPDIFSIYYGNKITLSLLHHTPDYIQVHTNFQMQMEWDTQFHEIKEALYTAENRNQLIVNTLVWAAAGRKGLVFTEHIAHARVLQQMIEAKWIKTYLLIWEIKDSERERIREEVKAYNGSCVVIGSVKIIGRGFDIPELSLAILTTAEKFNSNIAQYLGRTVRAFPWKKHPIFIDMVDAKCYPLLAQAKSRLATYKKAFPEWKVIVIK